MLNEEEKQELAQLHAEDELNSLGDRPQSMAVGKLRRMMELEDKEREDCFCDPDNIATCKRHVNELLATETARANAAEAELATLLDQLPEEASIEIRKRGGLWPCRLYTPSNDLAAYCHGDTPIESIREAVKAYLGGKE